MENSVRLMIANDNPDYQRENAAIFEENGVRVTYTPKDGNLLLEHIRSQKPDAVLAPIFMPGLDAVGVLHTLREEGAALPLFIVESNFTSPTLEREVLSAGAGYFAIQPYPTKALIDRIRQLQSAEKPMPAPGDSLEVQVTEILHQIGVPAHIKGYHYLRDSILMAIEDPDIINAVTKRLYPGVAKKVRDDAFARRARDPPRHRGCVGPRGRGCAQFLFRLYDPQHTRQADEFGIYRDDLRPPAPAHAHGRLSPAPGVPKARFPAPSPYLEGSGRRAFWRFARLREGGGNF